MKICPKCDNQNANNAAVCKVCGASLNEVPDVEVTPDVDRDTSRFTYAALFGALSFIFGFGKDLFALDPEMDGYHLYNFYIYFAGFVLSIVFAILCIIFLRGLFKMRPVPGKGIVALFLAFFCCILIFLDFFGLSGNIKNFKDYRARGITESYKKGVIAQTVEEETVGNK